MDSGLTYDPVPSAMAGIRSLRCECGWETVVIMPEEALFLLLSLSRHLVEAHGLPNLTMVFTQH